MKRLTTFLLCWILLTATASAQFSGSGYGFRVGGGGSGGGGGSTTSQPANTVLPVITGTPTTGQLLTASTGTWSGTATITYSYLWKRSGTPISGATASTYALVGADNAATITVTITASNAYGVGGATSAGVGPVTPGSCTESTAFLARTAGLDATHTDAYTLLICDLVNYGVWANLDVLHIYATQNTATAQLNLISSSYPATLNGSPTFTADRGYTGATGSTTIYINTGFIPSSAPSPKYTQNSGHHSAWSLTSAGITNDMAGVNNLAHLLPRWTANNNLYCSVNAAFGALTIGGQADSRGHYICNRSASNANQAYRNGASIGSSATASSAVPTIAMYAIGSNNGGTAGGWGGQQAMYSIGASLTAGQSTNFYNTLRTYMTAVGAP